MKAAVAESEQIGRKAEYLTSYYLTLIRRRNLLKALVERCNKLIKRIELKLWPRVDLELDGETKLVVLVKSTAVELAKRVSLKPKYKEICEIAIPAAKLKDLLEKLDEDKEPLFKTTSVSFSAKIIGRAESIADILKE